MAMFGEGLTATTLEAYTGNIRRLNGGKLPTSANFLKNTEAIEKKLEGYSPNTKKTNYITIVSYLKDKKVPKKVKEFYIEKMNECNKNYNENKGEKTARQEENWMSWEEVMKCFHATDPKSIEHLATALYVLQPPRRNKDFSLMKVVPEYAETMDKEFNYMDAKNKKFIFNNYKTQGAYGSQVIDIPEPIMDIIQSHYKLKKKFEPFFLLHTKTNTQLSENGLTRILNKVFGKKVSVSMLRNIYLSERFKGKKSELQEVATAMGTSPSMVTEVYTKD
jgi:hypothetical protein